MLNKRKRIPEAELDIMLIIWRENRRMTRAEIEAQINQQRPLAATTVLTFLARLVDKGLLSTEKFGRRNEYIAQVSQQDYQASQTQTLVEKVYRGSVKGLVASLLQSDSLSQQDLEELRQFWQEEKERQ